MNYLKIQLVSSKHTHTYAQQEAGKDKERESETKQAKGERHTESGLRGGKKQKVLSYIEKVLLQLLTTTTRGAGSASRGAGREECRNSRRTTVGVVK